MVNIQDKEFVKIPIALGFESISSDLINPTWIDYYYENSTWVLSIYFQGPLITEIAINNKIITDASFQDKLRRINFVLKKSPLEIKKCVKLIKKIL